MKHAILLFIMAAVIAVETGCKTRFVDYTVISTKNIDLSEAGTFMRGKARSVGEDKSYIIIFIPTGVPNLKEAIDTAIEAVPGAVGLLDGVASSSFYYIPYIFGESKFVVEGTPWIDPSLSAEITRATDYMIAKVGSSGLLESFQYVTKEEYEITKQTLAKR